MCPLWIWAAVCALGYAQASGTLQGTVRDAHGNSLSTAVYLQIKSTGQTLTARTGAAGTYRFTGLRAGVYVLRGEAADRIVALDDGQTKTIDLTFDYSFFDEPNFIVAGVAGPVSYGGHGSDTVLRSTEALAKATAELTGVSAANSAETPGDALAAVREYQQLAEREPSEPNLFNWGARLLMHSAAEPATGVFGKGHRLFPHSLRMLLGLAAARFARGDYDSAAQGFFEACDLNPGDATPYMFLGRVQSNEIVNMPGYVERLGRFAKLQPDNPWANYYYAVGLWKLRRDAGDSETPARVIELLTNAAHLDPHLGLAYLQMGIVYSDGHEDAKAIAAYLNAIAVSPGSEEAHYRLGQAYGRTGQKEKAREELEAHERLAKEQRQEIERQRSEIRQFVIELRDDRR